MRIEILNELSGVRFAPCAARAVTVDFEGVRVPLIARADLIDNKKAAGRPKDTNDAQQLSMSETPKKRRRRK